jgi:hypothetical protein
MHHHHAPLQAICSVSWFVDQPFKMVAAMVAAAPVAARAAASFRPSQFKGQAIKAVSVRAVRKINTVCRAAVSERYPPTHVVGPMCQSCQTHFQDRRSVFY